MIPRPLEFRPACFPRAAESDPERQHHQAQIQPERLTPHVQQVVTELPTPRDVTRRIDLSDPGEAGPHGGALVEPGDVFELLERSPAIGLDLTRPQRPRT